VLGVVERRGWGALEDTLGLEDFSLSTAFSQKVVSLAKGEEESGGYRISKEVDLPLLAFH
jgi:hypothetical protein